LPNGSHESGRPRRSRCGPALRCADHCVSRWQCPSVVPPRHDHRWV